MILELQPIRSDSTLSLRRSGDSLIVNEGVFDFSQLAEGDVLPRSAIGSSWFAGDAARIDGTLHLTLLLPHGPNASEAERFPEAVQVTEDGPIRLPGDSNDD